MEFKYGRLSSFPPVPTYDQCTRWGADAMRLNGTEARMGSKLHATFVAAGLPTPTLQLEALAAAGPESISWLRSFKDLLATLLPGDRTLRFATASELGVETLVERMSRESNASSSVLFGHYQVAAWVKV